MLFMTASQLGHLPDSVSSAWRGDPFRTGCMPFGVQCRPPQSAFFARYEPLEELMAPAVREAIKERVEGSPGTSTSARGAIQTATTAYGHAVSYDDSSSVVLDYVAELPVSAS